MLNCKFSKHKITLYCLKPKYEPYFRINDYTSCLMYMNKVCLKTTTIMIMMMRMMVDEYFNGNGRFPRYYLLCRRYESAQPKITFSKIPKVKCLNLFEISELGNFQFTLK